MVESRRRRPLFHEILTWIVGSTQLSVKSCPIWFPGDRENPDFVSNSIPSFGYTLHLRTKSEQQFNQWKFSVYLIHFFLYNLQPSCSQSSSELKLVPNSCTHTLVPFTRDVTFDFFQKQISFLFKQRHWQIPSKVSKGSKESIYIDKMGNFLCL